VFDHRFGKCDVPIIFRNISFFISMNIFVSNLNFRAQDGDLRQIFEQYGEISSAKVIMDRTTGRSRGFGFVEMPDDSQAQQAINALNNSVQDGKTITASEARPREDRPRTDRREGGYGGGAPRRDGGFGGGRQGGSSRQW
jgi:RNA recognition motif-containing protein